jgi:hypothetical protein
MAMDSFCPFPLLLAHTLTIFNLGYFSSFWRFNAF